MKKFVIVSDSCCELDEQLRQKHDIHYLPMYLSYDDKSTIADLDWKDMSAKELYDIIRGGTRVFTSQVPACDYIEKFEQYVKNGYDILSISCSSGLSASVKASIVARDELTKKYPDAQIVCVDSLICSMGLGMLCIYASKLRAEGKDIHQVAQALEDIKMNVNQVCTVGDLKYLKRAGRISTTTAVFGTMLNIKPIIVSSQKGENVSAEKVNGHIKSLRKLALLVKERYTGNNIAEIYIAHADCIEDAEKVQKFILELMPDAKISISTLNPIVGASAGPDTIGVYFVGEEKPNI